MITNDLWYEAVDANVELTQGDIILNCPVVRWASKSVEVSNQTEIETLRSLVEVAEIDLVVITQGCDLENKKVNNVILSPHFALSQYQEYWEQTMNNMKQNPTAKAWGRYCDDIKNGYIWNLSMLNEGEIGNLKLTHRIVDFHYVYTLPRTFLESFLQNKQQPRLRLRPPYREHLSQAFARFFMRVGLPTGVKKVW
jgi:hypothetical protein